MDMHRVTALAGILAMLYGAISAAEEPTFRASSRAQGADFDLTVTEIKREPYKSYLRVPGFHERTAAGSRWLMCAYTDLAISRGYSHWTVMYPAEGEDLVIVALAQTRLSTAKSLLGSDYDESRVLGKELTPVDNFRAFCGL